MFRERLFWNKAFFKLRQKSLVNKVHFFLKMQPVTLLNMELHLPGAASGGVL